MKKYFLLLVLISFSFPSFSQGQFRLNKKEYFVYAVVVDPGASLKEHGLNIGVEIEYIGRVYTRASITSFMILEDGYIDIIGSVGPSFTSGMYEKVRYYTGIRLGVISRRAIYPTAGGEMGIDFNITEKVIIGLRATYDYRSDFEFYDYPNEMRGSGFIRVGFRF